MATLIERLLIANRGEIAVRIARTAHRLGIDTVGVYSDADRHSLHVAAMDRCVALGGHTPQESYLRPEALIDAARRSGADAVHPGYGFLSENAAFAREVEAAGLIWVGPTPEQIDLLGDKVAAKRTAVEAGVPTTEAVVVSAGDIPDDLPMPALVKAAAGGGGRGMRVVEDPAELPAAIASASREAEAAFGDGTVFVEPYIARGRHVEVQVIGDHHGDVIHLGERECSIQRRNQKVIEEAPSPGIDGATRSLLCDGALALARHVGYRNAGTVEFMVGDDRTVTFLEVNTRLQVEHPVTEAVTGLDLVELQLRVAAGEPLGIEQGDVEVRGHAIEARLVAEDPAAGWMPATGELVAFGFDASVRVDAGVRSGSVVGADYDSLLAKVISHAPGREQAARNLARSLRTAELHGVRTNADCLAGILAEADFLAGGTLTSYLADHPAVAAAVGPVGEDRIAHLVAAVLHEDAANRRSDTLWGFAPSGWRNVATTGQRISLSDDATSEITWVEYRWIDDECAEMLIGALPVPDDDGMLGDDIRQLVSVRRSTGVIETDGVSRVIETDGVSHSLESSQWPDGSITVRGPSGRTSWSPVPRFEDHDESASGAGPVSPLPGTVVSVHVSAGAEVTDGELLVVVEAMKMEHRITARSDAQVDEVLVAPGDKVDAGDVLVTFTPQ